MSAPSTPRGSKGAQAKRNNLAFLDMDFARFNKTTGGKGGSSKSKSKSGSAPNSPINKSRPLVAPAASKSRMRTRISDLIPLVSSHSEYSKIVGRLCKILRNVLDNPDEQRYRSINVQNPAFFQLLGHHKPVIDFLYMAGFDRVYSEVDSSVVERLVLGTRGDNVPVAEAALQNPPDYAVVKERLEREAFEKKNAAENSSATAASATDVKTSESDRKMTSAGAAAAARVTANSASRSNVRAPPKREWQPAPYRGLKNQGATCYLNSLLQTMFHNGAFRRLIYNIPAAKGVTQALQELFISMQHDVGENTLQLVGQADDDTKDQDAQTPVSAASTATATPAASQKRKKAVTTKNLTNAFGWRGMQVFEQHDVQELARILYEKIENKLIGTPLATSIQDLLCGTMQSYLKCVDVDYESARDEPFYDISLQVEGLANLHMSLEQYVTPELLDGDNKYTPSAELGPQTTEKGVRFTKLPPVLHLHLKRFVFSLATLSRTKVNDVFEFPFELDMQPYCSPELVAGSSRDPDEFQYQLYAVFVHRGGARGGHYFAYVRPSDSPDAETGWLRCNDSSVSFARREDAMESVYGGTTESAYMLAYVRTAQAQSLDVLGATPSPDEIPQALLDSIAEFRSQRKSEAKLEQQIASRTSMYAITEQATTKFEENMFRLVFHKQMIKIDTSKLETVESHLPQLHAETGIAENRMRLWLIRKPFTEDVLRSNKSIADLGRAAEEFLFTNTTRSSLTLGDAFGPRQPKLFVEDAGTTVLVNGITPDLPPDDKSLMLCVRRFYPADTYDNVRVEHVGMFLARKVLPAGNLAATLRTHLDLPDTAKVGMFYNPTRNAVHELEEKKRFDETLVVSGQVIVIQIEEAKESTSLSSSIFHTVPGCHDYVINRRNVTFVPLSTAKDLPDGSFVTDIAAALEQHTIALSLKMDYFEVVGAIATKLDVLPECVRLTGHNAVRNVPKQNEFKPARVSNLGQMLTTMGQSSTTLYFHVVSSSAAAEKRKLPLEWFDARTIPIGIGDVTVESDADVAHVLQSIPAASAEQGIDLGFEPDASTPFRMMSVVLSKISRVYEATDAVSTLPKSLNGQWAPVRIEPIRPEEIKCSGLVLPVAHVSTQAHKLYAFGHPFLQAIQQGDTVRVVREKIRKRLGVVKSVFEKWDLCIIVHNSPVPLKNMDRHVLEECDWNANKLAYLGLRHADPATIKRAQETQSSGSGSSHSHTVGRSGERGIVISDD
jgi:ubiquitin carboxyl-terminal hydrolase 7